MRDTIQFQRQPQPYGCNYYSVAALCDVPDGWAEEHEADCSNERLQIRLWEQGYALWPFYVNSKTPAPREFWEALAEDLGGQGFGRMDYQVAIESPTYRGVTHAVGLRIELDGPRARGVAVVDTSGHDDWQALSWDEFLASPYSRATVVNLIWGNDLDSWAPVVGPEQPHALDPTAHLHEAA